MKCLNCEKEINMNHISYLGDNFCCGNCKEDHYDQLEDQ